MNPKMQNYIYCIKKAIGIGIERLHLQNYNGTMLNIFMNELSFT